MIFPILHLLVGLAGLLPALALGTGEKKFKIIKGGRSFDRFITIWLENQVSPLLSSLPHALHDSFLRRRSLTSFPAPTHRTSPRL